MAKEEKLSQKSLMRLQNCFNNYRKSRRNTISQTKQRLSSSKLIAEFEDAQLKKNYEIYMGDAVKVGVKITEGNKEKFNL